LVTVVGHSATIAAGEWITTTGECADAHATLEMQPLVLGP
jgi:hypothetical protein